MKKMISLFLLLLAAAAQAEIPEVRAKQVTCEELQATLLNYGTITVVTKPFIFAKRLTVSTDIICGAGEDKVQAIFKTADGIQCAAGFHCEERDVYVPHPTPYPRPRPDYRPYPRHRPDYRPSPRPRPDYRPSPRPQPRPDRGPRYNPPSSGRDRGPRYNPPGGGCRRGNC